MSPIISLNTLIILLRNPRIRITGSGQLRSMLGIVRNEFDADESPQLDSLFAEIAAVLGSCTASSPGKDLPSYREVSSVQRGNSGQTFLFYIMSDVSCSVMTRQDQLIHLELWYNIWSIWYSRAPGLQHHTDGDDSSKKVLSIHRLRWLQLQPFQRRLPNLFRVLGQWFLNVVSSPEPCKR